MKKLATFLNEIEMLTEVFIRGGKPRNGSKVLARGKNIWVWNSERELERLLPFINREYRDAEFEDEDDIEMWHRHGANSVYGEINGNTLDVSDGENRPSVASELYAKVLKALNIDRVRRQGVYTYTQSGEEHEHDYETDRAEFNKKLSQKKFYHGTCTAYIEEMLSKGLMPNPGETNFKNIQHADKVFITTEMEKALFHATTSANNTDTFPVVIEMKIPDEDKLISDYDVVINILGANSEEAERLGYADIYYGVGGMGDGKAYSDMQSRFGDRLDKISTKMGIFGYKGRIPASHFTAIFCDDDLIIEAMPDAFMQDFDDTFSLKDIHSIEGEHHRSLDYWNQSNPKTFLKDLENAWDDVVSEYQEDDDEDY